MQSIKIISFDFIQRNANKMNSNVFSLLFWLYFVWFSGINKLQKDRFVFVVRAQRDKRTMICLIVWKTTETEWSVRYISLTVKYAGVCVVSEGNICVHVNVTIVSRSKWRKKRQKINAKTKKNKDKAKQK